MVRPQCTELLGTRAQEEANAAAPYMGYRKSDLLRVGTIGSLTLHFYPTFIHVLELGATCQTQQSTLYVMSLLSCFQIVFDFPCEHDVHGISGCVLGQR